jgi:hypothetical protein
MPHKFKIGDVIKYRPSHRDLRTPSSECVITALLPERDGQFEYRIKHPGEDFERVVVERELLEA